jgi:hypothetical protein
VRGYFYIGREGGSNELRRERIEAPKVRSNLARANGPGFLLPSRKPHRGGVATCITPPRCGFIVSTSDHGRWPWLNYERTFGAFIRDNPVQLGLGTPKLFDQFSETGFVLEVLDARIDFQEIEAVRVRRFGLLEPFERLCGFA